MASPVDATGLERDVVAGDMHKGISPVQCRAGRVLLGWSQVQLATAAKVGRSSVYEFETGARPLRSGLRRAIGSALEAAGVEFLVDDGSHGPGVRLRESEVELLGCVRREGDWAVISFRYHGRQYDGVADIKDLERLAHRRFFSEGQINESVAKFKREVLASAVRALSHNPANPVPVLAIAASLWPPPDVG